MAQYIDNGLRIAISFDSQVGINGRLTAKGVPIMSNRLKEMGESAAWHLMVSAALKGGQKLGYALERQPGRGLSNVYEATKDGKMHIVSVRTTRDRWIAFPPLDGGKGWKTLD